MSPAEPAAMVPTTRSRTGTVPTSADRTAKPSTAVLSNGGHRLRSGHRLGGDQAQRLADGLRDDGEVREPRRDVIPGIAQRGQSHDERRWALLRLINRDVPDERPR